MIYFTTVHFEELAHAQGIGFTRSHMLFCWAESAEEARHVANAYCTGLGLTTTRTEKATPAQQQIASRYTFPEQIVGLPDALARDAITSCGYPEDIVADTLEKLTKRQATLAVGMERLCIAA